MSEKTALISGEDKGDHGSTRRRASRLSTFSRFGADNVEAVHSGVRPTRESIATIPAGLADTKKVSSSVKVKKAAATAPRHKARSFMEAPDGAISALTPVQMGRQELYNDLPFVAVPGMQRKERNLSVAFSAFAANIDTLEQDQFLQATTGKGMTAKEKEQRASRMSVLLLGELEADAGVVTTPLIFTVAIACMLQFNFGYNISVMSPPEPFVFPGHSTGSWSAATAAFCAGAPFGAALAAKWADGMGRRGAMITTTWIFIIGGLIQALAPSMLVVTLGRLVIGVASGASNVLVPIYLGELAPPSLRGVMGTLTQFGCVLGILFGSVTGFAFANPSGWRWMFFVISGIAMIQLAMAPFLLESPRWLLGRNPDSPKARFIIKKLRGFRYDEEVETEVELYIGASKSQSCDGDNDGASGQGGGNNALAEMFADKKVRLLVVSAIVLQMAQQFSGINAVFFYSGLFFEGVIENPLVGSTLLGTVNVLATFLALYLMDRTGRRTLVMWSSGGMFFSCVVIVMALLGYFSKIVALGAVSVYVIFFAIGMGPIPFLMVAEMFDSKYVTVAMGLSSQINFTCNFLVGLFFPAMNEALGAYSFGPFGVVLLLTFLYALIWLPETAGTTPEELQAELVKKHAGDTYHNMDIEGMAGQAPTSSDEWDLALAAMAEEEGV